MKKSKKPIIGGILLGVGVLGFMGIATTENKAALIAVCIGFIIAGAILLYLGIKANKALANMSPEELSELAKKQVPKIKKGTVVRDFNTKVVGVTFGNDNGSSRQAIIRTLKPGDVLVAKPVPTPEYPDAIGVFTKRGKQLGHLSASVAAEISRDYPNNPIKVTVNNITGGGNYNYGCNINIIIYAI